MLIFGMAWTIEEGVVWTVLAVPIKLLTYPDLQDLNCIYVHTYMNVNDIFICIL